MRIILADGRELVAEIHLDDLLDVFVDLGEPVLDLIRLRPNAAVDYRLLVVGDVHEAGEILAEPDGIENGARNLAGRQRREQPENRVVQRAHERGTAALLRFKKQRTLSGKREARRKEELRRTGQGKLHRQAACERFQIRLHAAELRKRSEFD